MNWTFVVLALVLFLFAIYIGFLCGQWACEKRVITKRDYWIANFAGAAAVVLLTWVFSLFPLVQFAPIGWLGGFIAGLKMSFGESVGPWRKHDEVFNVNKAHRAAADMGKAYGDCTFIVAHLGGGISMSLHKKGRVADVVGDDEGPFSPERAGGQQVIQLIKYLVMKNKTDMRDKLRVMRGDSGLFGYLGTSDARRVERMIEEGDEKARLVYEAMALQIAKFIANLAASVCGRADAVILTGGLAHSKMLTEEIKRRVGFIAPVMLYPGENEMESLAHGAYRILKGDERARVFRYDQQQR